MVVRGGDLALDEREHFGDDGVEDFEEVVAFELVFAAADAGGGVVGEAGDCFVLVKEVGR